LASLGVLTLHVWMFTVQGAHGRDELVSLLTGELRLGVVLFFVLSGYLLAGPWIASALDERPTPRLGRFVVRRAARILPAYWVAMLGSFWLLAGTGHHYEVSARQLPLFAAFGQNYVGSAAGRLDPPMWSLVVEVSFYAVLPLAGWLIVRCARRGRMVAACAGLAGLGLAWSAAGVLLAWPDTAMSTLPTFVPVFACGMAAAALAHRRVPSRAVWWALMAAGAALVCANAWWHHQGTGLTGHVVRDLPAALGFALLVAAMAAHPPAVLARAPLRGLGTISYGLYLWHLPVLLWLRFQGLMPGGFVLAWLEVAALSALVALASWVFVERPAIEAAGRWRPWTRRVPSFPAERHIRPVPSVA
ncbi:MAG TPA: acyltransferase, partial [Solirubrobacteraceae bacterium]|nr:acyltransferase [Solirubrobacteraceae bacterium]